MGLRRRKVGATSLLAAALVVLSACADTGETHRRSVDSPVLSSPVAGTPFPSPAPSFPPVPAPAPSAGAAAIRAAFGTGCASAHLRMPVTKDRATIGDVDGDGRRDLEWATIPRGGSLEFGVTTAAGTTIAKTVGFATGGQRSVSIGTLSTGQTVALPTDLHGALLYVIHDCRWVEPEFASSPEGTDFVTGYYDPPESGGGCVGRRLYQVESTQPSKDHETVTGVTEHISPDGRTVSAGEQVAFLTNQDTNTSLRTIEKYGDGKCIPSPRLVPVYQQP